MPLTRTITKMNESLPSSNLVVMVLIVYHFNEVSGRHRSKIKLVKISLQLQQYLLLTGSCSVGRYCAQDGGTLSP